MTFFFFFFNLKWAVNHFNWSHPPKRKSWRKQNSK